MSLAVAVRLEDGSLRERTVRARGSPCVPSTNRDANVSARLGGRLWRSEWSGGGRGEGEYYWLVGRRAVEFGIWGGIFAWWAGEFGAWSVSPNAVPRVSEEASRSAFRLREPCAGPTL